MESPMSRLSLSLPLGSLLLALLSTRSPCAAPQPPLPAIDLPHSYYYRELYLPQLTSGPSSLAWAPDSRALVFSRAGSLWRQRTDSTLAEQLTDGPGYDYQPDWSPDGRYIVYVSTQGQAMELWLLEPASGRTRQLTHTGAVNVEPRWSPDGGRIVYVSTAYHRHFHVFAADFRDGERGEPALLTGENQSPLPRYYYSAYDHEINPTWTRDGKSIVFVSNRGRIHGTGGFWRAAAVAGAEPVELRYEETSWGARPDFSPDGARIVYSSYLGRNWMQLWLMPASGGEPFPLTYGEWDETGPRWSPDGAQIAFISNRGGDMQLRLLRFPAGNSRALEASNRRRLRPSGALARRQRAALGERRCARAHELRRALPQHPGAPRAAGAGRGSRHRRESHREQGAAHPRHRLERGGGRPGIDGRDARRARAGIPHELLGPPRHPRPPGRHPAAGLRRLPEYRCRESLANQRRYRGSGPRARCADRLRASVRR